MSMRRLMARAGGGLLIALGAGHMNTLHGQRLETDQQLVTQVAGENFLEVRLGEVAEKKAAKPSVQQFGHRMVLDHTSLQKQWMTGARKNNLEFKASLTPRQLDQYERLKNMSGAELDRAYISLMVQNHQDNVNSLMNERNAIHSPGVRELIDAALPALNEHLRLARQVAIEVGADTTAAVATQPSPATQSVRADSAFLSEVDAANLAELQMARQAGAKAENAAVKRFAQKMATDHDRMQREWDALALRNGLRLNGSISPRQQEQLSRLEALSGTAFDRAYMSAMVQNHQENVNAFATRGRAAQSSDVRQLVERSLPSLQEHLTLARQVAGQVGAPTPAPVATGTDQGQPGSVSSDRKFIREVDADNFLEIQLGRLAEQKAKDGSVKQFGRKMVEDHTSLQGQWTTMASNNGMKTKPGMGKRHRSKLDRLEKLSGSEFDRAYMTLMVQNQKDYLDYFRKEGRGASSAPVRQLVDRGIPVLEQNLSQAKQIGIRVGADTTTARYGRVSVNK